MKMELTQYLAIQMLDTGGQSGKQVVVPWANHCKATHRDMVYLKSNHKEVDTKPLLHAFDIVHSGATFISIIL